jgi:hypothetical protein
MSMIEATFVQSLKKRKKTKWRAQGLLMMMMMMIRAGWN